MWPLYGRYMGLICLLKVKKNLLFHQQVKFSWLFCRLFSAQKWRFFEDLGLFGLLKSLVKEPHKFELSKNNSQTIFRRESRNIASSWVGNFFSDLPNEFSSLIVAKYYVGLSFSWQISCRLWPKSKIAKTTLNLKLYFWLPAEQSKNSGLYRQTPSTNQFLKQKWKWLKILKNYIYF